MQLFSSCPPRRSPLAFPLFATVLLLGLAATGLAETHVHEDHREKLTIAGLSEDSAGKKGETVNKDSRIRLRFLDS